MNLNNFESLLRCNHLDLRKQISSVKREEFLMCSETATPSYGNAGDRQSFGTTELASICFGFDIFVLFGKWPCQVLLFELREIQILQQLVFGTVVGSVKT